MVTTRPEALRVASWLALACAAPAQDHDRLVKLRDEKIALPVFQTAPWTFDYDQARERARTEDKPIFAYFTRSYAH